MKNILFENEAYEIYVYNNKQGDNKVYRVHYKEDEGKIKQTLKSFITKDFARVKNLIEKEA
ncbi:MAG: hypothetical protein ACRCX8_19405 [Sarcina sp.]